MNGPTPECATALQALARGGDGTDWDAVERHLATCDRCAVALGRMATAIDEQFAASETLAGAEEPAEAASPAGVTAVGLAPLPFRPPRRRRLRSPRTLAVLLAAAATAAVFAGAVVLGSLSSGSSGGAARKSVAKRSGAAASVASGSVASDAVGQQPAATQAAAATAFAPAGSPVAAAGAATQAAAAPAAAAATRAGAAGAPPAAAAATRAAGGAVAALPATAAPAAAAAPRATSAAPSSAGNPLVGVAEADRRPDFVPSLEVLPDRPDHTYFSGEQIQVCLSINQPSRIHLSVLEGQTTFDLYDADSDPGSHCFPEKVGTIRGRATLRVEVFYGDERVAREDFPLLPAPTPSPVP